MSSKNVRRELIHINCYFLNVTMAIDFVFLDRGIMQIKNVYIKRDNGIQLDSRIVELFLSTRNIAHERIHPATPKKDAHIESFNSILKKEVIRRFEFSSLEDSDNTISRFISFYNNERLHSAIDYRTPREAYEKWKEKIIEESA